MKKGQGLSLNTIIIAAIVLIVLIVLWAILTGRMGAFTSTVKEESEGVESCTGAGGVWREGGACDPGETIVIAQDRDEPANLGKLCCVKV